MMVLQNYCKDLANRMKKVLPKVIDQTQSTFITGRNWLDTVHVANETI